MVSPENSRGMRQDGPGVAYELAIRSGCDSRETALICHLTGEPPDTDFPISSKVKYQPVASFAQHLMQTLDVESAWSISDRFFNGSSPFTSHAFSRSEYIATGCISTDRTPSVRKVTSEETLEYEEALKTFLEDSQGFMQKVSNLTFENFLQISNHYWDERHNDREVVRFFELCGAKGEWPVNIDPDAIIGEAKVFLQRQHLGPQATTPYAYACYFIVKKLAFLSEIENLDPVSLKKVQQIYLTAILKEQNLFASRLSEAEMALGLSDLKDEEIRVIQNLSSDSISDKTLTFMQEVRIVNRDKHEKLLQLSAARLFFNETNLKKLKQPIFNELPLATFLSGIGLTDKSVIPKLAEYLRPLQVQNLIEILETSFESPSADYDLVQMAYEISLGRSKKIFDRTNTEPTEATIARSLYSFLRLHGIFNSETPPGKLNFIRALSVITDDLRKLNKQVNLEKIVEIANTEGLVVSVTDFQQRLRSRILEDLPTWSEHSAEDPEKGLSLCDNDNFSQAESIYGLVRLLLHQDGQVEERDKNVFKASLHSLMSRSSFDPEMRHIEKLFICLLKNPSWAQGNLWPLEMLNKKYSINLLPSESLEVKMSLLRFAAVEYIQNEEFDTYHSYVNNVERRLNFLARHSESGSNISIPERENFEAELRTATKRFFCVKDFNQRVTPDTENLDTEDGVEAHLQNVLQLI